MRRRVRIRLDTTGWQAAGQLHHFGRWTCGIDRARAACHNWQHGPPLPLQPLPDSGEKSTPLPCHSIVKKSNMRAAGSRATALATVDLMMRRQEPPVSRRLPRKMRCSRHMHRPPRIGGRSGTSWRGVWHCGTPAYSCETDPTGREADLSHGRDVCGAKSRQTEEGGCITERPR